MAFDVGEVTGALILHDQWNNVLDKAMSGIDSIVDSVREEFPKIDALAKSLGPAFNVAATGIATAGAALIAIDAAIYGLAARGTDINDVANAFEDFSGGAQQAELNMRAMRNGVKSTIDDFHLMSEMTRVLSAGVQVTSEDFNTMGAAASVLADRGLGSTKEMLDLVNDAMVTGKTRALSMKLGVIDLGDAQENFAASLGVEAEMLSEAGKAEANRVQVMKLLKTAVTEAGASQADFNDRVAQGLTWLKNMADQLAVAVANSPVLKAGVEEIANALGFAFGGSQEQQIKNIVDVLEDVMIFTVDVGIAAVEAARVIHTSWAVVETGFFSIKTAIAGTLAVLSAGAAGVLGMTASLPGATQGMKDMAESAALFAEEMQNATIASAGQAAEAAKGITQNSEFDKTLDKVGGTLFVIRDAMVAANQEAKTANEETAKLTENQNAVAEAVNTANNRFIDQAKALELQQKAMDNVANIMSQYNTLLAENSGSVMDKAIAKAEEWKAKTIAAAKEAHTDTKEFYDAVEMMSEEMVRSVTIDWDTVKNKRISALQEEAEIQRNTYNEMLRNATDYTRQALQEQLDKTREAEFAASRMGQEYINAHKQASAAADEQIEKEKELAAAAKKAAEEKKLAMSMGGSFEVPELRGSGPGGKATEEDKRRWRQRLDYIEAMYASFPGRKSGQNGPTGLLPNDTQGWTKMLQEQVEYASLKAAQAKFGFREGVMNFRGGEAMVGESGPELVQLPRGANVIPSHQLSRDGGGAISLTFYVNGTAEESARKIQDIMMQQLRLGRLLPRR